jgi:hypothetical protein
MGEFSIYRGGSDECQEFQKLYNALGIFSCKGKNEEGVFLTMQIEQNRTSVEKPQLQKYTAKN